MLLIEVIRISIVVFVGWFAVCWAGGLFYNGGSEVTFCAPGKSKHPDWVQNLIIKGVK